MGIISGLLLRFAEPKSPQHAVDMKQKDDSVPHKPRGNDSQRTCSPKVEPPEAIRKASGAEICPLKPGQHITHQAIADRAYGLWEQQGQPQGKAEEFWLLAEQELLQVNGRR